MERKPQQQTLSVRISDTLRDFLEEIRGLMANARNESVSISDVAKFLLESTRDDRLDFRLEVAELLQDPTESLVRIRRKWERRISRVRAGGSCPLVRPGSLFPALKISEERIGRFFHFPRFFATKQTR